MEMFEEIEEYGNNTICYTLDGIASKVNCSLAITKANELCNLDGGVELLRTKNNKPPSNFSIHGETLDFDIIYTTPSCKSIADKLCEQYIAYLVMIYE